MLFVSPVLCSVPGPAFSTKFPFVLHSYYGAFHDLFHSWALLFLVFIHVFVVAFSCICDFDALYSGRGALRFPAVCDHLPGRSPTAFTVTVFCSPR